MQQSETGNANPSPPARRALSPFAAFTVTALIILIGLGVIMVMADGNSKATLEQQMSPTAEPAKSDAEAEVITSLEALLELKDRAFDTHNVELLAHVYAEDTPAAARARTALSSLIRDEVHDASKFHTKAINVNHVSRELAVLERVNLVYPCFRSTDGRDITKADGVIEERVIYTLTNEGDGWQIAEVELVAERVVVRERSSCAQV